jgi:serine phosphatase RsbU (regulator of sigma subunit)/sugar lactone lactonase YvrE
VRAVFVDRQGRLWAGTHGGGLNRFDASSGRFLHFRHDPADPRSLSHDQLRSITQDRSGALWISTFGGGLDRLDPGGRSFQHHRHDPADAATISNDFIRLAVEAGDGMLWVGTQGGGLNRLDPTSGDFSHYRHDPNDPASLSNDHVFAIHEAADGSLWIGTFGGGLNHLDPASGRFRHFRADDGLASDSTYALLEDDQGRLWISTTRGLSRFDPVSESFFNYEARDGLQSNEFNGGAAYRSASGEMYFGGINGYNAFYPDEIGLNPVLPTVVITDLQLFNRSLRVGESWNGRVLLERPITYTEGVELEYRDNVLTLEFAALHFSAPSRNRYAYTMEGFADDWIPVTADRRYATFTGLAPGDYVFRVKGANADGVWNEQGAALGITVTPPFWGTWWFRLAALVAVAAVAWVALRDRTHRVRMKTQLLAARDAQMAIMPQSDPVVEGFEVSGVCIPAHEVGGDFFDYLWLEGPPRRLCVAVGDVAGKAMRAAMTAVMTDGMIVSRVGRNGSPEEIMSSVNRSLYAKLGERMFAALCLVAVDPSSGQLELANAGLCEPLLKGAEGARYLDSPGPRFPLGVFAGTTYQSRALAMAGSDAVLLYSDGVPEARNPEGDLFGYEALRELVAGLDTASLSAEQIRDAVVREVRRFAVGAPQSDDVAVVVIRRQPEAR